MIRSVIMRERLHPLDFLCNARVMDPLAQRVADRYLRQIEADLSQVGLTFPREFHLPPDVRPTPAHVPEGTDLAIWTWEQPVGPKQETKYFLIIFAGKANKPLVGPYYYRTPQERQHRIDETVKSRKAVLEMKERQQQERRDFVHNIQKGEIFVSSWGYDQTNIDFFEVVEIKGKMVVVREVAQKVQRSAPPTDYVVPVPGHYVGQPILVRPNTSGGFKVNDHSAHKWDGEPEYQTSSGWGH